MASEFRDRSVSVNGINLHYVDWGISGHLPMILLHGVTGNARMWDHIARAFRDEYHVMAVDMRGHGASGWSEEKAYESTDLASDLSVMYDELGLTDSILVGLSWGGLVSTIHTAEYPETVQRLILVDIGFEFGVSENDPPPRPREFEDEQALEAWERANNPYPALWTLRPFIKASVKEEDGKLVRTHDPLLFERWPFRNRTYWEYAEKINCPTLLLRGAHSFVLSQEMAEKTAASISNCQLELIPHAGHLIPLDNPPDFEAAVRAFLGG